MKITLLALKVVIVAATFTLSLSAEEKTTAILPKIELWMVDVNAALKEAEKLPDGPQKKTLILGLLAGRAAAAECKAAALDRAVDALSRHLSGPRRFALWEEMGYKDVSLAELKRDDVKQLLAALGQPQDKFSTTDGRVIDVSSITLLSPEGVRIIGGNGIEIVPAESLSPMMLTALGWSPSRASIYKKIKERR